MSREKGEKAEKLALSFLENRGFKIVQTNFYAKKLGEIDIVATKDGVYNFFEVKSALDFQTAILNISKSKLTKIIKSVHYYLQLKKIDCQFCISAIIITPNSIEIIENITI